MEDAWQASNGLRVSINEARNRQPEQAITVADVVDHYIATELAEDLVNRGKSYATRTVYREFLTRWVKPTWGSLNIREVRTIAVERWLHQLVRKDGSPLAPSTKAKIRNLMSVLFNHAIRQVRSGWNKQGTPSYSFGRVPSGKESPRDWNPKNCAHSFPSLIGVFV